MNFGGKTLTSLIAAISVLILIKILHFAIEVIFQRKSDIREKYFDTMRLKTLEGLFKSIVTYIFVGILIIYLISHWFGSVGVTLAGVGGLAIGFGAQSIIKDILSGLFIIMENKYKIGDFINLREKSGTVDKIGIRTTLLRDLNGDLHMVPNGSIDVVTNVSRGDRRLLVEVEVELSQSMEKVETAVNEACSSFIKKHENFIEAPKLVGIVSTKNNVGVIRVQGKATYLNNWNLEIELRRDIIEAFHKEGVKLPRLTPEERGEDK